MDTKKLRQKILDLAIRGKLVSQNPNDEPASVLLDRIRAEKERLIAEGKIKRPKKSKTSSDASHYQQWEIPSTWVWTTLGEISEACLGKMLDKSKNQGNNRPYLRNVNVRWYKFDLSDLLEMPFMPSEIERYTITKGDLVVCEGGEPGRCAIWDSEENIMFQKALHRLRFFKGIDAHYVAYLLDSLSYSGNLSSSFTGSGIKHLTGESMSKLQIPLPPYTEQKEIVKTIKKIDKLIGDMSAQSGELEQTIVNAKSKILELAMQGKLVPQDPTDEAAADMLRRINPKAEIITDNPHSWNIPEEWCWVQLGDIFYHNTGKALNNSNKDGIEYEYITTSNVYWGRFELESLKKMFFKDTEIEKCRVRKGDLLICEGGDVGRSAIWEFDNSIMIQNHLHRLRPYSSQILPLFYFYMLMLYKSKDLIGGKGIALQGFSSNALHKLVVPLPPLNEQKQIVAKIEELFGVLDTIKASLQS